MISPPSSGRSTSRTPAKANTPILQDIQGLDATFQRDRGRRVRSARHQRRLVYRRQFPALPANAWSPRPQAVRPLWRTSHQRRLSLLQPADARRRDVPRHRLAGAVGQLVCSRRGPRPAHHRRPGTHPSVSEARRGDPHAADRPAVLAGHGPGARAEPLAALDGRAQSPAHGRRQAAADRKSWPAAPTSSRR